MTFLIKKHLIFIASYWALLCVFTTNTDRFNQCPNDISFILLTNRNSCRPDEVYDYLNTINNASNQSRSSEHDFTPPPPLSGAAIDQKKSIMAQQQQEKHVMADELRTRDDEPQIASYDEWTKQKMQEQRIRGSDEKPVLSNGAAGGGKPGEPVIVMKATRNYASKECGAKILAANPEAQNPSAVLNEKERDEYMLNPCLMDGGQKWLVVELCETVQITRFELANFELFSSRPKDFKVWISERYPFPEWTPLGQWTADDKREPHGFDVEPQGYAKYLKLELINHYGNEHFCSLTLIRVFGISMVEEYENEALSHQPMSGDSASHVIPSGNNVIPLNDSAIINQTSQASTNTTASTTVAQDDQDSVMVQALDKGYLNNAKLAVMSMAKEVYGKVFNVAPDATVGSGAQIVAPSSIVQGLTPASNDSSCATNSTSNDANRTAATLKDSNRSDPVVVLEQSSALPWSQCVQCSAATTVKVEDHRIGKVEDHHRKGKIEELLSQQPRFCAYFLLFVDHFRNLSAKRHEKLSNKIEDTTISGQNSTSANVQRVKDTTTIHSEVPVNSEIPVITQQPVTPTASSNHDINDTTMPTVVAHQPNYNNPAVTPTTATPVLPGVVTSSKESVFVRLNSRIRALEMNISLSGQYLSELSKKYRRQMEEIQRAFNATSRLFSETDAKFEQRLEQQARDLHSIQNQLATLTGPTLEKILLKERYAYGAEVAQWLIVAFLIELAILFAFYRLALSWQVSDHRLELMVERAVARRLSTAASTNQRSASADHKNNNYNLANTPLVVENGPLQSNHVTLRIEPPVLTQNVDDIDLLQNAIKFDQVTWPSTHGVTTTLDFRPPAEDKDEQEEEEGAGPIDPSFRQQHKPPSYVQKKKRNKRKQQNQLQQKYLANGRDYSAPRRKNYLAPRQTGQQQQQCSNDQTLVQRKVSAEPPRKSCSAIIGRNLDQGSTSSTGILFTGCAKVPSMTSSSTKVTSSSMRMTSSSAAPPIGNDDWSKFFSPAPNLLKVTNQFQALGSPPPQLVVGGHYRANNNNNNNRKALSRGPS